MGIWKESIREILVGRLKTLKSIGYNVRSSGAALTSCTVLGGDENAITCDVCELEAGTTYGYEADYPKNKDVFICERCESMYHKLKK